MGMREIVFDTETTGLSPIDGHRLVEIGCVELINKVETGRHFHAYINPGRSMPSEAEAVHGLSATFLSDKPVFADIARDLVKFIGECPLVAHNAIFDMGFLNWELEACGYPVIGLDRMVDTLAIARGRHPGAKHSLDALCTRYGVDRSHRVKHGALLDAQLLAQVYVELMGGRQIGLTLGSRGEEKKKGGSHGRSSASHRQTIARPPRYYRASEAERERHARFVAKLVEPLWADDQEVG